MSVHLVADKNSYPAIMKWGNNTELEWYHPLTSKQHHAFNRVCVGDIMMFFNDNVPCEIIVDEIVSDAAYAELQSRFGPFQIGDRDVTHVIRVRRI
jgi:hypothetical protein